MRLTVFILVLGLALPARAQFRESFRDGELGHDPCWTGVLQAWQVVPKSDVAAGAPESGTLRLNASGGAGIAWLATQVKGSWGDEQEWSFFLGRRSQAAEAYNCALFWLYSSEPTVASTTIDGYRVRFGDDLPSGDRLVVEQVTNGTASPFINSGGSIPPGLTDYGLVVRVTRTAGGLWTLYTSVLPAQPGTGAIATDLPETADVWQGVAFNNVYTRFDDGYLALGAIYTNTVAARTALEFDQIQFTGITENEILVHLPTRSSQINASIRSTPNAVKTMNVETAVKNLSTGSRTSDESVQEQLNIWNPGVSRAIGERCVRPEQTSDAGGLSNYINIFYPCCMPGPFCCLPYSAPKRLPLISKAIWEGIIIDSWRATELADRRAAVYMAGRECAHLPAQHTDTG